MAIIVPILSQFNDKGIKDAVKEFQKAKTTLGKFTAVGSIFEGVGKSLTKNVTAPMLAIGGAVTLLVRESMEAQAVQHRLAQLLRTTGGATEDQIQLLLQQAAALEKVGVVSKENVMVVQSQLATFDLQASTIAALTPAILDYVTAEKGATATADDFRSMTNGLAQALNGQFGSLTRAGFVIDDNTKKMISNGTEAERAAGIVEVLGSTYDGFNESLRQTPEGRLIALQLEFSSLREELGTALTPIFLDVVDILREDLLPTIQTGATTVGNFFKAFSELDEQTKKNIIQFAGIVLIAGPVLIALGAIIKGVVALSKAFILLMKSKLLIPLAIAALIGAFRAQSDAQYQLAKETGSTWLQIARVVELGIENILFVVENLINGFKVAGLAIDHFGRVVNNAFKIAGGQLPDSLMSFEERLQSLVKHNFVDLTSGVGGLTSVVQDFQSSLSAIENTVKDVELRSDELEEALANLNAEGQKNAGNLEKQKEKADKLKKALIDLRKKAVDQLKDSLGKAQDKLNSARQAYDNFKNSIKSAITGIINFQKAGEGADFLAGLTRQADKAKSFSDKIKKLIKLGLSEAALQQVIDAGAEAGSLIADQIIAGGADMVKQVNKLVRSVESLAEQTGKAGADKFYAQGIAMGEAIVNGLILALENAQAAVEAAIKGDIPGAKAKNKRSRKKNKKRAEGGPALFGESYLVGERGPEIFSPTSDGQIIPLDKLSVKSANGGGGGVTININAGNVVGSKEELLSFIQRGLREYDRRNGKLNINA